MLLSPPFWWYKKDHFLAKLLTPLGSLFGHIVERRWQTTFPYKSKLPVICIGNFTVGGAGKTPTAIAIAERLQQQGEKPAFLTRGYLGKLKGPHIVDPNRDLTRDVGDEALLLAKIAPTVISKDRPAGARLLELVDATIIIMDDGFQNPSIKKDFSIAVVDAEAGIGNGKVFPAGPLRADLTFQLNKADAILSVGNTITAETSLTLIGLAPKNPFFRAKLSPMIKNDKFLNERVIAYCGIGRPEKFFKTIEEVGAKIVKRVPFPDHHNFSEKDASKLLKLAKNKKATLLTTQKDHVRLNGARDSLEKLAKKSETLPIQLDFKEGDAERLMTLMTPVLKAKKKKG